MTEWLAYFTPPVLTALFIGGLTGWWLSESRLKGHDPARCDRQKQHDSQQLELARTELADTKTRLAVSLTQAERVPRLEHDISNLFDQIEGLNRELREETNRCSRAEQEALRIPHLETELAEKDKTLNELRVESTERSTRADEKLASLQKSESIILQQVELLAQRILDEKTRAFTEQNKLQMDDVLTPLREQLGEFRTRIDTLHLDETRERASLRQEIINLNNQTQRINEEAVNLTRALKGDKKMQGTWGEMILERVLEQSGLRKGIEYETQATYSNEEQQTFRPDVIIHLPEGRDIIVDSKVSLIAYERYCNLENTQEDTRERDQALREHLSAIRTHVRTLGNKNYSDLKGVGSLDFVLMFIPVESAFMLAFHKDERVFTEALSHGIVITTPTTLLATLRTIENIWRTERRNENAKAIADKAGLIYDKLRGFVEDMEKLGIQLNTAQKSYDEAMKKLTQGKGNLIRQAESFVELGAKVNKRLPKSSGDEADD